MNNEESFQIFEECLQAVESGEDLDSCLSRYPSYAQQLRPALIAAQMARQLSDETVPNTALQRSRTRLLARAAGLRSRKPRRPVFWRYPRLVFSAFLLATIFFLSWRGLINVSAKALPGDPLYQVKLVGENLSLQLAPGIDTRREMFAQFEQRRVDEVVRLLGLERVVNVRFTGIIEGQQSGEWKVDGIVVRFDPNTPVNGEISPGMVVQVAGQTRPEGWVQASIINLYSYQFIGLVEAITNAEWNISGVRIAINRSSQIDPAIRLGDMAIVLVQVNEDQSLRARAILRMLSHTDLPSSLSAARDRDAPVMPPLATEVEFSGIVEEISEDSWRIDGRQVTINNSTEVEGTIIVGDRVKVHALMGGDGSLFAREIEGLHAEEEKEQLDKDSGDQGGTSEGGTSEGGASEGGTSGGGASEIGDDDSSDGGSAGNEAPDDGGNDDGSNPDPGDDGGNEGSDDQIDPDGDQNPDGGDEGGNGNPDGSGDEGSGGEDSGESGDEDKSEH
jgi:hypothetical protein